MPRLNLQVERRRLLVELTVYGPEPTRFDGIQATALVDTGATVSGIGPRVIAALNLNTIGKRPLGSATEERMVAYYLFRLGLPGAGTAGAPAWPHVFDRIEGFSWARETQFDVITGMDVLIECGLELRPGGACVLEYGTNDP